MRRILGMLFAVIVAVIGPAAAQTLNTTRAQGDMYQRILTATNSYARQLGLDDTYVAYCQTKLSLETSHQPPDGLIPYGVNYNTIATQQQLDQVIAIREAFETVYLRLCLADAKSSMLRAGGH